MTQATRGALFGAGGGILAALVDFALAYTSAASFMPKGRPLLAIFLCAFYGVAGALVGIALGLLSSLLKRATLAPHRLAVAVPMGILAIAGHGLGAVAITELCLKRFHHRVLIAAVVGASTSGIFLALIAIGLLLSAIGSRVVRLGRARTLPTCPPSALFVGAAIATFWAIAGTVTGTLIALQARPRMTPAARALQGGLAATIAALGLSALASFVLLRLMRALEAKRATLSSASTTASVVVLFTFAPVAVALALWGETLRQLDGRPWRALAIAIAGGFLMRQAFVQRVIRPILAIAPMALGLVAVVTLGGRPAIRKAAQVSSALVGPSIQTIQRAFDFDRDGYASILGGGDCNDLDRRVHPGAFDWPDDGIDQNCNHHEASSKASGPRVFATLPDAVPKQPNVVLITVDALRADHVSAYGYARKTTPTLDALAEEGVRFSAAWSHAPSTRYSVPAILTGRYPSTIAVGSAWWPPNVLSDNRLLAEMFKERGYQTAAYLPYYYFNRQWGLDQGFDVYDISLEKLHSMGGNPAATHGTSSRELADLLIAHIEQKKTPEPFFLWAHFYDTHFHFERHPSMPESNFGDQELDLYDGEIRFTDAQIGRVFDALKRSGEWSRTVVLVTSDHGEGFGEHNIPPDRRHGYHLYRTETKIPLIVRAPGIAKRVVTTPAGHVDIVPTLLNLARLPTEAEPQLLGKSLVGAMLGDGKDAPREVFQEVWYEGPTSKKALVDDRWHYIRNLVPQDTAELYDVVADPAEDHDLSGQHDDEAALETRLSAWMDEIALPHDFARRVTGNVSTSPLPFAKPIGDRLGDALVVAGVDIGTPKVKAGDFAEVTLIFEAIGEVPEGWRLFTHFVSDGGRMINADHEPLEGAYPLANLTRGTWLRDRVRVPVPANWPAGPMHVEIGLWRGKERLPARGKFSRTDVVRCATVEVLR